jgi:YD repeat-containing protein
MAIALGSTLNANAQVDTAYEEQSRLIRAPGAVNSFGANLFGDLVNLYNGQLNFQQTDISIRGNNQLPVMVGRRVATGQGVLDGRAFGRWELDVPHIHGVFPSNAIFKAFNGSNNRCSSFGAPPPAVGMQGASEWDASEFWQGTFMYVPGYGDQQLLSRSDENTQSPGALQDYPVVTAQFWSISCLPTLKNDIGQGFKAVAPDGTQYYFDWLAKFSATTMQRSSAGSYLTSSATASRTSESAAVIRDPEATPVPNVIGTAALPRTDVWLLVSKVVDRFGNTVTYTYDAAKPRNLVRIESSDNRVITLSYTAIGKNDVVQSVYDGTRTWTYSYHGALPKVSLDTVVLPDGSSWDFSNFDPILAKINFINNGGCDALPAINSAAITGQIRHPSGASATFNLTPTIHGRSGIQRECDVNLAGEKLWIPRYFATQSLTTKTINGPGLNGMTWAYDYGARNESWDTCQNCPTTKTVAVTDPDGFVSRYSYGNRYQQNEGRLELTELGWNGSSALRTVAQRYRAYGAGPYPNFMGYGDAVTVGDGDLIARLAPVDQRMITQQGITFTWEATDFNNFAQVTAVTRASSLGQSRIESMAYDNNLGKWVLGQISSVTEGSGKVMVSNGYNPGTANLESVSKFGRLYQSMTYNPDGTLATRSDPAGHSTSFSNYKRGIPQYVAFPDGGSASAVVNNIGGIDSTTDAYGNATNYRYDLMGRLSRIMYPTNDSVAWNETIVAFQPVGVDEYGIAAGHWRQIVSTGNAQTIDYYDALWRPVYSYTADLGNPAVSVQPPHLSMAVRPA